MDSANDIAYEKNLNTNKIKKLGDNIEVWAINQPFEDKGKVYMYQADSGVKKLLMSKVDYSRMKLKKIDKDGYNIFDIEVCGKWLFYKMEASIPWKKADVGWRPGSKRVKTQAYRQNIKTGKYNLLYEY